MTRQHTPTRPALVLGVAGLALALTACSPLTTDAPYAASDGIRAQVGDLEVLNLMIVSSGAGEAGRLLGAASSSSSEPQTLTLTSEDGSVEIPVSVGPGATVNFSDESDEEVLDAVSAAPGDNLRMTLSDGSGESVAVYVPVLDGTLPEYAESVPTD